MIAFANGGLVVEQHQHPQEQHMHHRHYLCHHHLHHLHPLAPSAALRIRMMTAEVLLVAAAANEVLLVIGKITISISKEEIICAAEEDRRN